MNLHKSNRFLARKKGHCLKTELHLLIGLAVLKFDFAFFIEKRNSIFTLGQKSFTLVIKVSLLPLFAILKMYMHLIYDFETPQASIAKRVI